MDLVWLIVIVVLVLAIATLVRHFSVSMIALEPRLTVFFAPNLTSMS
jgi:hypothetical protein